MASQYSSPFDIGSHESIDSHLDIIANMLVSWDNRLCELGRRWKSAAAIAMGTALAIQLIRSFSSR
jgi:hypothetical protein|nr:MAG TPA: hypothetical protein [Caudoviricetes sp.]